MRAHTDVCQSKETNIIRLIKIIPFLSFSSAFNLQKPAQPLSIFPFKCHILSISVDSNTFFIPNTYQTFLQSAAEKVAGGNTEVERQVKYKYCCYQLQSFYPLQDMAGFEYVLLALKATTCTKAPVKSVKINKTGVKTCFSCSNHITRSGPTLNQSRWVELVSSPSDKLRQLPPDKLLFMSLWCLILHILDTYWTSVDYFNGRFWSWATVVFLFFWCRVSGVLKSEVNKSVYVVLQLGAAC